MLGVFMKPQCAEPQGTGGVVQPGRVHEAEALMQIARLINEPPLDVDGVCQRVVESALTLLPVKFSGLTLLEPDGGLRLIARGGEPLLGGDVSVLPPGTGVTGRAVEQGSPFWSPDVRNESRVAWPDVVRQRLVAGGQRALLAVPLRPTGRTIGALTVADRVVREFVDAEIRLVQALADQAAIAISHAQLFTEQARTETALRLSERRYRLLAENMADVVTLLDLDLRQIYVSPSVQRLRGYTPEVAMRQRPDEQMTPASAMALAEVLREEIAGEAAGGGDPHRTRTVELELLCRDGSTVWAETTVAFLRDETGRPTGIIGVSRDIADRKRTQAALLETEARLHQIQRIEAIGRLAAGVAHDFNNLLVVIMGRAEALLHAGGLHATARRNVEQIKHTVERAAQLTRQLLAFARKQVLQPQRLNLNALVAGMAPMLERLLGSPYTLITLLDPNLGSVHADRTQVEQIILNLVVNARDAMPRGGRIGIETTNVDLDERFVAAHPGASVGPHVRLQVSDTGQGMTPEVQAKIFEPFFTTKEVGKGTGLGLATVYGIVKQHEGYIGVESAPGIGSVLRIYLRRQEGAAAATILVVEHDRELRALAVETLVAAGYSVLAASEPETALDLAGRHGTPIHLLVTDAAMPQMTGPELTARLRLAHAGLRVIYISASAADSASSRGAREPYAQLSKPFTLDELTRKVRELLDRPGS
jgi:two-component system, cell cycle sensor histidine kinase and response regulator CckA